MLSIQYHDAACISSCGMASSCSIHIINVNIDEVRTSAVLMMPRQPQLSCTLTLALSHSGVTLTSIHISFASHPDVVRAHLSRL